MIKIIIALLLFSSCGIVSGCSLSKVEDKHIRGYVVAKNTVDHVLITNANEDAYWVSGVTDNLQLGQYVDIIPKQGFLDSYPVQAFALETNLVQLDNKQESAVRKVLEKNKRFQFNFIKSIVRDEIKNTWEIRMVSKGLNKEEKERIITVS